MNTFTATALSVSLAALVTGCSTTDSANEEDFKYAINERLAEDCLMLTTYDADFPVTIDVPQTERERVISASNERLKQYNALVDAGLLNVESETREVMATLAADQHEIEANTYSLTEQGKQALKTVTTQSAMGGERRGFCVASYKVNEVLEFSEPLEKMGETVSYVQYSMVPTGIEKWGKSDAVQQAFPNVASRLEASRRENATLVLTDDGWVDKTTMERPY